MMRDLPENEIITVRQLPISNYQYGWNTLMRRIFSTLLFGGGLRIISIVFLLCSMFAVNAQSASTNTAAPDCWFHFCPNDVGEDSCYAFARSIKDAGYSTLVLLPVGASGGVNRDWDREKDFVDYCKAKLGMKVVPTMYLLGKCKESLGKAFVRDPENAGLLVGDILDPYADYKGKPALESLIFPLMDKFIAVYGNPEYFHLGWDEYATDEIAAIAAKHQKTVSEVWAGTLNRVCEYLLAKGITPIIWGDQLLSPRLATGDNPVGYPGDKGFLTLTSMHSRYPDAAKTDLLEFVKDIKNRDKIIVGDWHYRDESDYPSLAYLKWLGFKDVIPTTKAREYNMKMFSAAADRLGFKRKMASLWGVYVFANERQLLWPTVYNNIYFFKNSGADIPEMARISVEKSGKHVSVAKRGDTVTLRMTPSAAKVKFEVFSLVNNNKIEKMIILEGDNGAVTWQIPETISNRLFTITGFSRRDDGYLLHGIEYLFVARDDKALAGSDESRPGTLLCDARFSKITPLEVSGKFMRLGQYPDANIVNLGDNTVRNDSCIIDKITQIFAGSSFYNAMREGHVRISIDITLRNLPDGREKWMMSWGEWGCGFRFGMNAKNKLYARFFGSGSGACVASKTPLEQGKRYKIVFDIGKDEVGLEINGEKQGVDKCNLRILPDVGTPINLGYKNSTGMILEMHEARIEKIAK
jgi:hypothetical protein